MVKNEKERPSDGGRRRKRVAKAIAVINADQCTGCEACRSVCPSDCIELIETGLRVKGGEAWCEVDLDRCIGCALCVRVPQKKADPYELKICPWGAIEMVPAEQLSLAIAGMGGPESYVIDNRDRLLDAARRVSAAHAAQ